MTMPPIDRQPMDQVPMDQPWSELWMVVADVFQIKGRGTVVTGRLEGTGELNLGDTAMADGVTWLVSGIEKFRVTLATAEPGDNIGIMLGNGPDTNISRMLRGVRLLFLPQGAALPNQPFTGPATKKRRWQR